MTYFKWFMESTIFNSIISDGTVRRKDVDQRLEEVNKLVEAQQVVSLYKKMPDTGSCDAY